jgi:isochorismate pyruvate lyase
MPEARDCTTMAEVREEIDRLDRAITALIVERLGFIEAAGRIKPTRDAVRDEARKADVLAKVQAEAARLGGSAAVVAAAYEALVEASIAHEFRVFDTRTAAE